jgi:thioredoxin reductase (NADPH)
VTSFSTRSSRGGSFCLNRPAAAQLPAQRIEQAANVEILTNTTVHRMNGNGHLDSAQIVNSKTGEQRAVEAPGVFCFVGAKPRTSWLPPEIERDA